MSPKATVDANDARSALPRLETSEKHRRVGADAESERHHRNPP
jgi:hypothetical protein